MRPIVKRFGDVQAVDDFSVDLYPGVGLPGYSGAAESNSDQYAG
jgi:ABC-type multidrug transport system ATPase subunit